MRGKGGDRGGGRESAGRGRGMEGEKGTRGDEEGRYRKCKQLRINLLRLFEYNTVSSFSLRRHSHKLLVTNTPRVALMAGLAMLQV